MENISLKNPYPNGVKLDDEKQLQPFIDIIDEVRDKILAGERVYVKIISGERKGSIAYIECLDLAYNNDAPSISHSFMYKPPTARIKNPSLNVILRWDKRRNRIKWPTYDSCEYLRGSTGPTVWEKFDRAAAEKKMLAENDILDRDGIALAVGDRVLYINARYGSGASLDRGTIEKIHFSIKKYQEREFIAVHVIIKNDNGSKSDIKNPNLSILKIEEKAKV